MKRKNNMKEENDGWMNPTCEEIDDIEVLNCQSIIRPYKALMIESLGKREI